MFATEEMLGTRAATGTGAATGTPVDTLLVVTFRAATTGDITLGGTPETTLADTTQVETIPVATTPETTVMAAMWAMWSMSIIMEHTMAAVSRTSMMHTGVMPFTQAPLMDIGAQVVIFTPGVMSMEVTTWMARAPHQLTLVM